LQILGKEKRKLKRAFFSQEQQEVGIRITGILGCAFGNRNPKVYRKREKDPNLEVLFVSPCPLP
jgi:hypothetical protein